MSYKSLIKGMWHLFCMRVFDIHPKRDRMGSCKQLFYIIPVYCSPCYYTRSIHHAHTPSTCYNYYCCWGRDWQTWSRLSRWGPTRLWDRRGQSGMCNCQYYHLNTVINQFSRTRYNFRKRCHRSTNKILDHETPQQFADLLLHTEPLTRQGIRTPRYRSN